MSVHLEARHVTKHYGTVLANDSLSLSLSPGEVLCLLGENGAGKSTLARILGGDETPDSGELVVKGDLVRFRSPADARSRGVVLVHQQRRVLESGTVWENLLLGNRDYWKGGGVGALRSRLGRDLEAWGITLPLERHIAELSEGDRVLTAIAAGLLAGAECLLLDEPAASQTEEEREALYTLLGALRDRGLAILIITHRLTEAIHLGDRFIVLREGTLVGERSREDATLDDLQTMMVGEAPGFVASRRSPGESAVVAEIRGIQHGRGRDTDIHDFSLTVSAGEVVGITGIRENGLRALEDLLSGMVAPSQGQILFDGVDITRWNPGQRHRRGWSYIPSNRAGRGSLLSHSLGENLMARTYGALSPAGVFRDSLVRKALAGFGQISDLRDRFAEPLGNLSGGNAQRVLLARELAGNPKLVLACEPAWGLDTRHRRDTYEALSAAAEAGAGVILLTGDVEEALTLSDRIAVLHRGALAGIYRPEAFSHHRIASAMLRGTGREDIA